MKLKLARIVHALYIKNNTFVEYFDSYEDAEAFAKKHYPNIESYVLPLTIMKVAEQ